MRGGEGRGGDYSQCPVRITLLLLLQLSAAAAAAVLSCNSIRVAVNALL